MKKAVFFATPTYDANVSVEHHGSVVNATKILADGGYESQIATIAGSCFVDQARNKLVKSFLESGCSDLFFVDADIGFDPLVVPRFMESPHDIVVGIPPKRKVEAEFHIGKPENGEGLKLLKHGALPCKEAPTAFMRIKRRVFDVLNEGYPQLKTMMEDPKEPTPYFQWGYMGGKYIGEDIFFCRLWSDLGHMVWYDPNVDFTHRGSHGFTGNCLKYLVDTKQVVMREPLKEIA